METATRATEAEQEFALRSHKLQTQTQAAIAVEKSRYQTEIDAVQTDLLSQKEHIEAAHLKRKNRITAALQNARKRRGEQTYSGESELHL